MEYVICSTTTNVIPKTEILSHSANNNDILTSKATLNGSAC